MSAKLKASFDDPAHGWVCLTIECGEHSTAIIASSTPSDSLSDLITGLGNLFLCEGEARIVWHYGRAETELRFLRAKDVIKLEVWYFEDHLRDYGRGEKELEVSGGFEEICLPFWRALRSLQGRFSADELTARWHRPFPSKEIDVLTKAIKDKAQ